MAIFKIFQMLFSDLKNSRYNRRYLEELEKCTLTTLAISRKLRNESIPNFNTQILCTLGNFHVWDVFSLRSIFPEILALKERSWAGRAAPGRFMTETSLGGKKKHFFFYGPYSWNASIRSCAAVSILPYRCRRLPVRAR